MREQNGQNAENARATVSGVPLFRTKHAPPQDASPHRRPAAAPDDLLMQNSTPMHDGASKADGLIRGMPVTSPPAGSAAEFPSTRSGWIGARLALGEEGRLEVVRHVMASYALPLERYLRGSSYRQLGDPKELVQGFLADKVTREDFFQRWAESEAPLRRWLMNGFLFYLRESARRQQRGPSPLEVDPTDGREDSHRQFEREWGNALITRALERARQSCERRGQSLHWELLVRHHLHGIPYATLIAEHGISAKEAATMVRTASAKLRKAIFDQFDKDGVEESQIDAEIIRLMEALRP